MKFIGIQKIWYGNVFTEELTAAKVKTWIASATEVKNSHEGTWGYTQDDPNVEDYINELTGKPYHRDVTSAGNKTITWTMGDYDFSDMIALEGGETVDSGNGWASGEAKLIYKGIVAKTKTGNYIVFTNANITAKTDQQQKALGLGITAVAMESETVGVKDEYRFKGSSIDTTSDSSSPI